MTLLTNSAVGMVDSGRWAVDDEEHVTSCELRATGTSGWRSGRAWNKAEPDAILSKSLRDVYRSAGLTVKRNHEVKRATCQDRLACSETEFAPTLSGFRAKHGGV